MTKTPETTTDHKTVTVPDLTGIAVRLRASISDGWSGDAPAADAEIAEEAAKALIDARDCIAALSRHEQPGLSVADAQLLAFEAIGQWKNKEGREPTDIERVAIAASAVHARLSPPQEKPK